MSEELHGSASSMESWMRSCTSKFCSKTSCRSFRPCIRYHIGSCKTMIRNIPREKLGNSMLRTQSTAWWKTPAESPNCNPIENLWHELKEYIRREAKPKTKEELISGIQGFWATVNAEKCTKYIRHLRKVMPRVIALGGDATGY